MNGLHIDLLDYQSFVDKAGDCSTKELIAFLLEELPYLWRDAYEKMILRQTSIVRLRHSTFEYIYDNYSYLESTGAVPYDPVIEDRLVAVLGLSRPRKAARDDYRLKGWVGPTEKTYGRRWDKGHFIAHSIGGAVDRLEINVFVQRRDMNRGWSAEGKRYREMEKYCVLNPSTLCFSRPIYVDQTSRPAFLEFGIFKDNRKLWIECFDNR
jgi:hypothetical protein